MIDEQEEEDNNNSYSFNFSLTGKTRKRKIKKRSEESNSTNIRLSTPYNLVRHTAPNNLYSKLVSFSIFGRLPSVAIHIVHTFQLLWIFFYLLDIFIRVLFLFIQLPLFRMLSLVFILYLIVCLVFVCYAFIVCRWECFLSWPFELRFVSLCFSPLLFGSISFFASCSFGLPFYGYITTYFDTILYVKNWKRDNPIGPFATRISLSLSLSRSIARSHSSSVSLSIQSPFIWFLFYFICVYRVYMYIYSHLEIFARIIWIRSVFRIFRSNCVQFD